MTPDPSVATPALMAMRTTRTAQPLFASTIFTSAFLLFLVQPLVAKQVLPWFGGSAAVWSICMVFFQTVLLAGYAYADVVMRRLSLRAQAALHATLLIASLGTLPIIASPRWKPTGAEDPTLWILGLLLATIGLPYFLLCTTGPLLQSWLARFGLGARVYRYFSLSNLASLVSLLCYPVLIEPALALKPQAWAWSGSYAAFVLLCCAVAWRVTRLPQVAPPHLATAQAGAPDVAAPTWQRQALWLALPALGSWLLLAITNHLTQNVAAIPFLWVLPLVTYLLTFTLCFESDRWYRRGLFLPLAAVLLAACAYGLQHALSTDLRMAIALYGSGLFVLCMVLHGETARSRPAPAHLTRFYLMLSLGGALGGIAVGLVAPAVLPAYYELGLGFVLTALAAALALRTVPWATPMGLVLAAAAAAALGLQVQDDFEDARQVQRNFYGTLITLDHHRDDPADDVRQMYHGAVRHGEQFLAPQRRREPTTYYGPTAGIGRALDSLPGDRPHRVGLIGLGAGTLATYARPGDVFRLYEINPQVFVLADTEFSFLRDSAAHIERVLGDARLALEREAPQQFDVLAVDAFSGDSVPIHLLTREAMAVYWRHMRADGIVAFHLTNRFLALPPVVEQVARANGLHTLLVHDEDPPGLLRRTDWMLVARDPAVFTRPGLSGAGSPVAAPVGLPAWTDDFNNLFSVLK